MPFDIHSLSGEPRIGDGWIGGELARRGLSPSLPPDAANVHLPEAVEDLAAAYVDAGATLLCTNTLNANRLALQRWTLADRAGELNRRGSEIARRAAAAAGGRVVVAGQIGPTGRFLSLGETTAAELDAVFGEQAAALERGGADLILLGRFSDLDELLAAMKAVRRATVLPLVAAMLFDWGAERMSTADGVAADQAGARLAAAGADVIGCDCAAPETALSLVQALKAAGARPVFARINAGGPQPGEGGRIMYGESPAEFAERGAALREAGAAIVAGCCGATVEHIRALHDTVTRPAGPRRAGAAARAPDSHRRKRGR